MKTVEILQYTLRPGSGAAFHAIMQEISVPLHQRHGIDVVRFGNSLHDPDCYCLIRAFDNPESMTAVLEAFYASDAWRSGPRIAGWFRNRNYGWRTPGRGERPAIRRVDGPRDVRRY